jgi:hypothetical protein
MLFFVSKATVTFTKSSLQHSINDFKPALFQDRGYENRMGELFLDRCDEGQE